MTCFQQPIGIPRWTNCAPLLVDFFLYLFESASISMCSNIPAVLAYMVYTCKLIQYSRACISYHDCLDRSYVGSHNEAIKPTLSTSYIPFIWTLVESCLICNHTTSPSFYLHKGTSLEEKRSHIAVSLKFTFCYIYDVFSPSNTKFGNCDVHIYPIELEIKNTIE